MRSVVVALIALTGATACSTTARLYSGEPRPPSEVATIIPGNHHDVAINRVDGVHNGWQRVEVVPGRHTIEGTCMPDPDDDYCPVGEVSANLEAGKTYVLEASTFGMSGDCEFFVEEATFGKPTMADRIIDMLSNRN